MFFCFIIRHFLIQTQHLLLHAHMCCHTVSADISMNIWHQGAILRRVNDIEVMMPRWNAIATLTAHAHCAMKEWHCPEPKSLSWSDQICKRWLHLCKGCSRRWKVLMTTASYSSLHICWTCAMKGNRWSWLLNMSKWLPIQLGSLLVGRVGM